MNMHRRVIKRCLWPWTWSPGVHSSSCWSGRDVDGTMSALWDGVRVSGIWGNYNPYGIIIPRGWHN